MSAGATAVLLGVAAGGAYVLLRTTGSPARTARAFLSAWAQNDLAAMRAAAVSPPVDFDQDYQALRRLGVTTVRVTSGRVVKNGAHASVPFTAALTLPMGVWRYQGRLALTTSRRKWKVVWSPEAIHPDLHAGQRLRLSYHRPVRAHVLAADGTRIDGPGGGSGSVQQLVGYAAPITAKTAQRLGPSYQKGDVVGRSGIELRFDKRLSGTPATTIGTADAAGHPVKTLGGFPAKPGRDVKTSLDPRYQHAALSAVQGQTKPTSFVAMRPSSGQILAVANLPGGFDRAMQGNYAPGSTFKVVTAYALLRAGLDPSSRVQCPKVADVGGQKIHNSEGEEFGDITFENALAQSCNTAFALQTHRMLNPARLSAAANTFGFNQRIDPGVKINPGSFPTPTSDAEMAVAGFGQGRDLSNALSMAGVAAGVAAGTWHPPTFVTEPQVQQKAKATRLDPGAVSQLTQMMRAVVTSGTAKPAGLPAGTAGKTGTAEYGSAVKGKQLPTHAWFMGFRGDVAFAVVVEGGGFGAKRAAPIAARFLKGL